jgi:Flp pilus assembly protein TadD
MFAFDLERLTAARGSCHLRLGQLREAEAAFTEALGAVSPDPSRHRAELLVLLATAVARQGRLDEACALAGESLAVVAGVGSAVGVRRVERFRQEVDRWHDHPAVTDLDERLAAV